MKKIVLFLVISLLTGSLFGQYSSRDSLNWKSVGQHVDLANAICYTAWQYHKSVTLLNEDVFHLYRAWEKDDFSEKELFYFHQDYLNDAYGPYRNLKDFVSDLKEQSFGLPPGHQDGLPAYGEIAYRTLTEIDKSHQELESLVGQLSYQDEASQQAILEALKRQGRQFDLLGRQVLSLEGATRRAYEAIRKEPVEAPASEDAETALAFQDIVKPAKQLMNALRDEDEALIEVALNDLEVARELFFVRVESELDKIVIYEEGKVQKPPVRFDFVLKQLDDLLAYGKDYLKATPLSRLPYSEAYFFFNERLLPQFNRHGLGISYQANLYLDQFPLFVEKEVDVPNWFEPIDEEVYDMPLPEELLIADMDVDTSSITAPDPNSLQGYASNNMVLLLDVSSSMDAPEKLGLLKSSFRFLVGLMRPEDYISIVTYSGNSRIVLGPTSAKEKEKILSAIDSLQPEGKTSILNGINRAVQVAEDNFIQKGNNKIILATDGAFEEEKKLWKLARDMSRNDIQLSVLYFSRFEKQEERARLKALARNGSGNYVYVEGENADRVMLKEAQKIKE